VLFVSRRLELPLSSSLARKWDAVGRELEFRVVAGGNGHDEQFRLSRPLPALDGPAFFAALPARVARELRTFRPHAVLAQGAHETAAALAARRLARVDTAVIADIHGDWRAPTRLYGSRLRAALSPVADRVAMSALRNADGIRTVTSYTTSLVRDLGLEPADEFPAFMDFDSFLQEPPRPLPGRPQALFVGVLERYNNVDEELLREVRGQARWDARLTQTEVSHALDESTALVLPSRSEGMGRVIVEAFCRARPVVATRVGGIPDLVEHGRNGLLVEPGDTVGLADALVRILSDRALAERLAEGAHASAGFWTSTAEEFAARVRALVAQIAGLG
jgi:glycosyltransferase involved in cell wall biosynthesis